MVELLWRHKRSGVTRCTAPLAFGTPQRECTPLALGWHRCESQRAAWEEGVWGRNLLKISLTLDSRNRASPGINRSSLTRHWGYVFDPHLFVTASSPSGLRRLCGRSLGVALW